MTMKVFGEFEAAVRAFTTAEILIQRTRPTHPINAWFPGRRAALQRLAFGGAKMPGMARSGLQAVSRGRQDPLTDAETVRLARALLRLLGIEHVSYPDDTTSVVVQIWGTSTPLPEEISAHSAA
jgi:hypothetical protein